MKAKTRQEQIYYRIANVLPCAMAIFKYIDEDDDFTVCWMNNTALKYEDVTWEQVEGKSIRKTKGDDFFSRCLRIYKDGGSETFGHDLVRDGEIAGWIEVSLVRGPLNDLVMIYQDISERRFPFPAQDDSSIILKSLVNATPDWIFVKDKEFRYIFVNDGFAGALNRRSSELVGRNDVEAGFPDEMVFGCREKGIRGFRADDADVLTKGMTVYNPYDPARFGDGSIHIFDTRKMPLYNDQGEIYGVLGIARDITHRKETEDALARSEKLSRALLEANQDVALLTSADGDVLAMNGRCNIFFSSLRLGNKILDLKFFDDIDLAEILEGTEVVSHKGKRIEESVYDVTFYPLLDQHEKAYQFAIFIRDITNEVRLAEQLRQSEKMRAIGHLAGGVAHDFNNQLAGIIGYLELLESRLEDETLSRYAKNALRGANRAADLTKQLLAFSRKGKNLSIEVNVHDLIEEVVAILERSLDKKITLSIQLHSECLCTKGDPTQLQNSVLNLALNARDAMPNGGTLLISTTVTRLDKKFCKESSFDIKPGEYVELRVHDSGQGISRENMERIFEPFYTTKPEGKGVGMGLSAVYGTVNNHNGAIELKSELGKGTDIKLYFPKLATCNHSEASDESERSQGRGNILIVDDEQMVAEIASEMLVELGYQTKIFFSGREAIEYYLEYGHEIDLVLFDMVMPQMNGLQLFEKLITLNPALQGVVMSGYGIDGQVQSVLNLGAKNFLSKPFTFEDLSKIVQDSIK